MLAWPSLDALGVDAFVTTRHGGVSAGPYGTLNLGLHVGDTPADVVVNRRRVAAALGTDLGDFVFCQQAHGRRVAVVSGAERGRGALAVDDAIASTDALVTTDPGTVLAILVADCVPIILIDPQAQVLACVHAGWRGTVAGVTGAALHFGEDLALVCTQVPRGFRSTGSMAFTPVTVLIKTRNRTPIIMVMTFEVSPRPNQRMKSGKSADFGIG